MVKKETPDIILDCITMSQIPLNYVDCFTNILISEDIYTYNGTAFSVNMSSMITQPIAFFFKESYLRLWINGAFS